MIVRLYKSENESTFAINSPKILKQTKLLHSCGKMDKKLVTIAVIVICIVSIAVFVLIYETNKPDDISPKTPEIEFRPDSAYLTLTVMTVNISEDTDLLWSDVSVKNGSATLPTGTIDIGDEITNCSGFIELVWIPTNEIIWSGEVKPMPSP